MFILLTHCSSLSKSESTDLTVTNVHWNYFLTCMHGQMGKHTFTFKSPPVKVFNSGPRQAVILITVLLYCHITLYCIQMLVFVQNGLWYVREHPQEYNCCSYTHVEAALRSCVHDRKLGLI